MSQKRSGGRDINELKARLGLKSQRGAASPSIPGTPYGVGPPPGAPPAGRIPAPPGVSAPIPDLSQDPFGAVSSSTSQASSRGVAFEPMLGGHTAPAPDKLRWVKVAGLIVVPLVFGAIIGKIAASNSVYNSVIDDAGSISDEVKTIGSQLTEIQAVFESARSRGNGQFLVSDSAFAEELAKVSKITAKASLVYESNMYSLDPNVVATVLGFFSDVQQFSQRLSTHLKTAKAEADALALGEKNKEQKNFNPRGYGVVISMASSDQPFATVKLAQLGLPVCEGQSRPSNTGCPGAIAGFQYRLDETSSDWKIRKFTTDILDENALIAVSPDNPVLHGLAQGGAASVAEAAFRHRVGELDALLTSLLDRRKLIQDALQKKSNESKKLSF